MYATGCKPRAPCLPALFCHSHLVKETWRHSTHHVLCIYKTFVVFVPCSLGSNEAICTLRGCYRVFLCGGGLGEACKQANCVLDVLSILLAFSATSVDDTKYSLRPRTTHRFLSPFLSLSLFHSLSLPLFIHTHTRWKC